MNDIMNAIHPISNQVYNTIQTLYNNKKKINTHSPFEYHI